MRSGAFLASLVDTTPEAQHTNRHGRYSRAMSDQGLAAAVTKMQAHHCSESEIDGFTHAYRLLESGETGLIPESSIDPLVDPAIVGDGDVSDSGEALRQTAILKLNGGLGTSMGLAVAKTLLPVREGLSFLDLIVKQVQSVRAEYGAHLPVVFMNSFHTRDDTVAQLAKYPDIAVSGIPVDFVQSQYPKIAEDDLTPVSWPADPDKEWCPPGHGEVFSKLASSGVLDALLDGGYRYLSLSNGDNLGAVPDARLAQWFAESGAPFAMEVCERTPNDRKGGHLAIRKSDGHLVLRELAQTPPEDVDAFMDASRHRFFNTNNLWVNLVALRDLMSVRGTHLGLPLIKNRKTVDPADPASPPVVQLESAMGAAIEVFDGATAVRVDRSRFLPVKTTNELLLVRSDMFDLLPDGRLVAQRTDLPRVDLDGEFYKLMDDFEQRIPEAPSLRESTGLRIRGDVTFEAGVSIRDRVRLEVDQPTVIGAGTVIVGDPTPSTPAGGA